MSFFDSILDLGSSLLDTATDFFSGDGLGSSLVRTAATTFALSQVSNAVTRSNAPSDYGGGGGGGGSSGSSVPSAQPVVTDPGVRIQLDPNTSNRIPVLYGEGFVPGMICDAQISADQKTMTVVLALTEATGRKLSDNLPSAYTFNGVYIDDQLVTFASDGVTVASSVDRDGNADLSAAGLITIRVYVGNSEATSQISQAGGSSVTQIAAYDVVPTWESYFQMSNLVFAVVTVTYNAEKGINKIPNCLFHLNNNMTLPGDCLYDYAINKIYGAGLNPEDIYSE